MTELRACRWIRLVLLGAAIGCTGPVPADPTPGPAPGPRPDVVILMTDQQRFDELGLAGTMGARTPALDELARSGVWFRRAFVPAPQCSPSRAAMLTGRYPHRAGVTGNVPPRGKPPQRAQSPPLDPAIPNLRSVFAEAGYRTAWFGKWHLGGSPAAYGFDAGKAGPGEPTARLLAYLEREAVADEPLFLVGSFLDPHTITHFERRRRTGRLPDLSGIASALPDSLDDDLAGKPTDQRLYRDAVWGGSTRDYTPADWEDYLAYYHSLTTKVDAQIGQVLGAIWKRNPETLVIFLSDHGDLGGAHGMPIKGPMAYDELIRVPLIFVWPGRLPARQTDALASSIDLLPTLCRLLGLEPPEGVDGVPLFPRFEGPPEALPEIHGRERVFASFQGKKSWRAPLRMVRTEDWKYVRYRSGEEELYHLARDPGERANLAGDRAHGAARAELSDALDSWLRATRDPFEQLVRDASPGDALDKGSAP